MGFACPVCDEHVPDADHLADHLAFAAVTGASDHERWLDEHAPDWAAGGTDELAPRVTAHAEEVEFDVETEPAHGHEHGHGAGLPGDTSGDRPMDADAQQILAEAAALTEQMYPDETPESDEHTDGENEAAADGHDDAESDAGTGVETEDE